MVFGGTWHPVLLASGITAGIFSFGELGRLSKAMEPGHVANLSQASRKGKRFLWRPRAAAGWELLWATPCAKSEMWLWSILWMETEGRETRLKTAARPSEGIHRGGFSVF